MRVSAGQAETKTVIWPLVTQGWTRGLGLPFLPAPFLFLPLSTPISTLFPLPFSSRLMFLLRLVKKTASCFSLESFPARHHFWYFQPKSCSQTRISIAEGVIVAGVWRNSICCKRLFSCSTELNYPKTIELVVAKTRQFNLWYFHILQFWENVSYTTLIIKLGNNLNVGIWRYHTITFRR